MSTADSLLACMRHDGQWRGPQEVHGLAQAYGVEGTESDVQHAIWRLLNERRITLNGRGELRYG